MLLSLDLMSITLEHLVWANCSLVGGITKKFRRIFINVPDLFCVIIQTLQTTLEMFSDLQFSETMLTESLLTYCNVSKSGWQHLVYHATIFSSFYLYVATAPKSCSQIWHLRTDMASKMTYQAILLNQLHVTMKRPTGPMWLGRQHITCVNHINTTCTQQVHAGKLSCWSYRTMGPIPCIYESDGEKYTVSMKETLKRQNSISKGNLAGLIIRWWKKWIYET